jgi:hypothetical protein
MDTTTLDGYEAEIVEGVAETVYAYAHPDHFGVNVEEFALWCVETRSVGPQDLAGDTDGLLARLRVLADDWRAGL